ncbi:hypothetical protein FBU59_005181 [Linderina macrospora]|uniref:Uncharacterized protein n=1 Tax=Linderina macrospora TaxID=4868 RepID=A0ACC1J3J3_9FUNG|nr:hypothetical protein FBU59_005181 [Linderina macrospora]
MARNQATQPASTQPGSQQPQRPTSTSQSSTTPRRHEPLALLNIDGKQFLEIRQGYSPIMVPSHMLETVRTVLAEHLRRYLSAQQPQVSSPPQSPPHVASTPSQVVTSNPSTEVHASPSLAMVPQPPPLPLPLPLPSSTMTMTAQPHTSSPSLAPMPLSMLSPTTLPPTALTPASSMLVDESSNFRMRHGSMSSQEDEEMNIGCESDDEVQNVEDLKKPANAFILYRAAKTKEMRTTEPKLSVEVASSVISKRWRTEKDDIKKVFQDKAQEARDRYFAKKKRILARQKLRKDREDAALLGISKTLPLQQHRTPSGTQFANQLAVAASRELANNSGAQMPPHSATFASNFSLGVQPQPQLGLERAMTLPAHSDMSANLLAASVADTASLVAGMNSSALTPGMSAMNTNGFNLGVGTSGGMLNPMGFSQTMDPSLTHFKTNYHHGLDSPLPMTSATLTPTLQTTDQTAISAASAWPMPHTPLDHDSWSMISSLIQSSGADTNIPLATPYVEDQGTL